MFNGDRDKINTCKYGQVIRSPLLLTVALLSSKGFALIANDFLLLDLVPIATFVAVVLVGEIRFRLLTWGALV